MSERKKLCDGSLPDSARQETEASIEREADGGKIEDGRICGLAKSEKVGRGVPTAPLISLTFLLAFGQARLSPRGLVALPTVRISGNRAGKRVTRCMRSPPEPVVPLRSRL